MHAIAELFYGLIIVTGFVAFCWYLGEFGRYVVSLYRKGSYEGHDDI